jgi:endoglucanase
VRPRAAAAALGVALVAGLLLLEVVPGPLPAAKAVAQRVAGYPAWRRRAAERSVEPPFARVAASQVGYAPSMRKQFTSPRRFESFRVVSEPGGEVALEGGAPVREVDTELLGDVHAVWIGDFTPLAAEGRYRIVLDHGLSSFPFDVRRDVFDGAVRAVQRALYFQRAFTEISPAHAEGPWTHASDAHLAPPGERRGWHDAGDFSVYNASTASALFWLLSAEADFGPFPDDTNLPESGNGVPDLLDEARWALEWMLSVQEPSGGFRNATCQERYGRYGTNRPEGMSPYRSGEPGTLATGRATGTLAFAAHLFRPFDPAFAERCLAAARRGHAYLALHPGESTDGPTCPAFRQDGAARAGRHVRMYAAAGMLLATGEGRFRDDFEASFEELSNDPSAYRFNVYAALLYLRAPAGTTSRQEALRARLRQHAAKAREDGERHPFGWASRYFWGSIAAGFHRAAGFSVFACLADPEEARADCEQALANVHYALGRNFLQRCYVSGLGGVTRGRSHAFHQWLAALGATPFVFPGLVAGGPTAAPVETDLSFPHARPIPVWGYFGDPAHPRDERTAVDGRYTDNDSWSTNELDVDWQGVALYELAFARWWARRLEPGR